MKEESKKSMMSPMVLIGVLGALLIGGLVVYAATNSPSIGPKDRMPEPNEVQEEEDENREELEEDMEGVEVVEVQGGSFYFEPNEIEVEKGDTVKLTFKAMDGMHDFVVDELAVKTPVIKSGETYEVEFVASQEGEFEFYCSVGEHRAKGMVGKLIVEE